MRYPARRGNSGRQRCEPLDQCRWRTHYPARREQREMPLMMFGDD